MKIAYSIGKLGNSGGIERVLSTKANYLSEILDYEVHIIAGGTQPESLFYPFSDKIRFHYLGAVVTGLTRNRRKSVLQRMADQVRHDSLYRQKLEQKLIEIQPDITISTFGKDAAFLYKLKDGSRKVLEFHFTKNYLKHLGKSLQNDKFRFIRRFWLAFLQQREAYFASKYQHIVVLTEKDKQLWGGGVRFTVIPNPLSFNTKQQAKLENKRIVSMGRLVYPKGFSYLIDAFALIHKQFPAWQLWIYGDGQEKQVFQNQINALSLQDKIILQTPDADVEAIMQVASVFVLPSLYDGFGLVLTEAMVCGVPCVAFDCECGPAEIITGNEDGFLVELKNTQALAAKMAVLMENVALRQTMGRKAAGNIHRFDTDKIMALWQTYFNRILQS